MDFGLSQLAFREAARRLGMEPRVLQAVLWFAEQKHYQNQGWERPVDPAERDYRPMMKSLMEHGPLTTHVPGKEPVRFGPAGVVTGHKLPTNVESQLPHMAEGGTVVPAGDENLSTASKGDPLAFLAAPPGPDQGIRDRMWPYFINTLMQSGGSLATLGIGAAELHRLTGAFGKTAAEPEGMYNLGTGGIGARRPKTPRPPPVNGTKDE